METIETDKLYAVVPCDDPSPVAYMNVFERGDIWMKIQGCDDCALETKALCCNKCPVFTGTGCNFHESEKYSTNKPFQCVVKPTPDQGKDGCKLEYKCIKGSLKGKIRRLNESLDNINV